MSAPHMRKEKHETKIHGMTLVDEYFWFRNKENPEVIEHLHQENKYTESILGPFSKTKEEIFEEIKGRLQPDEQGVPVERDKYFYYSRFEKGLEYPIFCRKEGGLESPEQVVLDINKIAEGRDYCQVGSVSVSPDHRLLAFAVDTDGSEIFTVRFQEIESGKLLKDEVPGTSASFVWAEDNQTFFYATLNDQHRPDRIFRHQLEKPLSDAENIYFEDNGEYFIGLSKSKDKKYVFIEVSGKITSEIHFISSENPFSQPQVFAPRQHGVEYDVDHGEGQFFICTNRKAKNFKICTAQPGATDMNHWTDYIPHHPNHYITDFELYKTHLVVEERIKGLPQIRLIDRSNQQSTYLEFDEPTYDVHINGLPNYESTYFRYSFSSPKTLPAVYDCELNSHKKTLRKKDEIPTGFNPDNYETEWIYAKSHDGKEVPLSLFYKKGMNKDGTNPVYLYGYGSYGMILPDSFSRSFLSMVDRGFIFVRAHVRGGAEMGRDWYETGKFLNKTNTFKDFISAAEHLIEENFTRKGQIAIEGGSAGGMLIGAVVNMRPDLFHVAVADVPFVDVLNTMLDETLPLTPMEFHEWGNPKDKDFFDYMLSYSPYENIQVQEYPHILAIGGLNDPRVTYWEPSKWVAKLREYKTDNNHLLLYMHMGAGHGGKSGRYQAIEETAMKFTFVLKTFDWIRKDS